MGNVDQKSCIEELLNYTLTSFINGTLKSDLGLSKSYCSDLLLKDSNESIASADNSSGMTVQLIDPALGSSGWILIIES